MIRLVFGSLDKAASNAVVKSARASGLPVETETATYSREFVRGKGSAADPLYGEPVYIVRIRGERAEIEGVIGVTLDRKADAIEGGRSWWAT